MKPVAVTAIALSIIAFSSATQTPQEQKLLYAFQAATSVCIDSVGADAIVDAAISGMMSALDPHSTYLPAADAQAARRMLDGKYTGYGMQLSFINDTLTVEYTMDNSPARRAGVADNDKIIAIGGLPTTGDDYDTEAIKKIIGTPKRKAIEIDICRPDGTKTFRLKSETINLPALTDTIIANRRTAVIKIGLFDKNTDKQFAEALKNAIKSQAKNLIVDLRGNSGGYIKSAIDVAGYLFEPKTVIVQTGNRAGELTTHTTSRTSTRWEGRLAIVVDGRTASAAEVLAAAVQDHDRGIIVGRPTFGKGLLQRTLYITDGSELHISYARCIAPSGRCTQRRYTNTTHRQYAQAATHRARDIAAAMPDSTSTPFKTLKNGRTVYDHCGITPDIIIPFQRQPIANHDPDIAEALNIVADIGKYEQTLSGDE